MRSFSEQTKSELFRFENTSSCCDTAEFAGMMLLGCVINKNEIKFITENTDVRGRFLKLCNKLGCPADSGEIKTSARSVVQITDLTCLRRIFDDFELTDLNTGVIRYRISEAVTADECCRRAFVRGAFMGGGTVIDPRKNYNLEIITPYMGLSKDLTKLLGGCGFAFKTVMRKSKYVLYLKNGGAIQDFLSYIGAYNAQMELINIMIEKEIRNDVVRSVNSESANFDKTIEAAVRQIQAINTIDEKLGIDELPEDLKAVARLRLENSAMSLGELGKKLNPPLGKSGVNHRLKKIEELAERLKYI